MYTFVLDIINSTHFSRTVVFNVAVCNVRYVWTLRVGQWYITTTDGAVHRPDGTPNMTCLHRMMKKKKVNDNTQLMNNGDPYKKTFEI